MAAGLALFAGCASADDASTSDDALTGAPSYVGTAVTAALRAVDPGAEGTTWDVTTDNTLDADFLVATPDPFHGSNVAIPRTCSGEAGCDPDFQLATCAVDADCGPSGACRAVRATVRAPGEEPRKLCVGDAETLVDDVYDLVTSTESFLDIASLSTPQGRFTAALRNGLSFLAAKNKPIAVRMVFGNYLTEPTSPPSIRADVTRDLPAGHQLNVTVGAFRSAYDSWNHAKIVAVDGERALVGGHNMWQDDYLSKNPVSDVSMRVRGGAAGSAHRFVDALWTYTCATDWYPTTSHVVSGSDGARCAAPYGARSVARHAGNAVVIGAGRLGEAGTSNASDTALTALLGAARKTVRLSLQDMGPPTFVGVNVAAWPTAAIRELALALGRGVDVYVTLSNKGAKGSGGGSYSNGWQAIDVAKKVRDAARSEPSLAGQDLDTLLCTHLHVTTLRHGKDPTWPDGTAFQNHSKLAIVDEQAFYIGSQNLYIADLAEFGYIVDDVTATKSLLRSLWAPEWADSSLGAVTGTEAATCLLR